MLQAVRLVILAAVLSVFSNAASAATGIALLVGNEKYVSAVGPLDSPSEDLELIKRSLLEVGLNESDIVVLQDASRIQMLTAVEEFARKARDLNNDEIAFFYYAGHGAKKPDSGSGLHLIPTSARNVESTTFWYETINFNRDVIQTFTGAGSRAAWIVAIDACRNELKLPSSRNIGGGGRGFGVVPSSSGMLISFAADDNQTAKDKIEGATNSPYALALSKHLRTPNQRISSVFGAVRPDVMERTAYVQEPVYTNKLNRDPILIEINAKPTPKPTPTPHPKPTPGPMSLVQQLQQEMADLGTDVRNAIAAYDNGKSVDSIAMRWKKENGGNYSPRIARLFKASCLLGQPVACTDYGYLKDTGNGGVTVDVTEATNYYKKGCDGGNPVGCANLGYMYEKGRGTTQNYYSAVTYYRKGCDGGNARGCTNLGYMYDAGNGVPKNYAQAVAYYQKGCDGDNAVGCNNLGTMYEYGLGVSVDKPKAVELYQKTLRLKPGYDKAEKGLARLKNINPVRPKTLVERLQEDLSDLGYEVKNAIAANDSGASLYKIGVRWKSENNNNFNRKIARVFDAACQLGDGGACVDIGFIHERGYSGYPVSYAKAVEFYRSSCIANFYLGCSNLGYMYEKGRGVTLNETTAVRYYRTACNGGNARGCTNLGYMYETGKGMSGSDLATAVTYYRKGCDGGNGRGCTNLGYMYEKGRGTGSANLYTAVSYYKKGCDKNDMRGCTNTGYMYETGRGATRNYSTAVTYYTKACNANYARGCTNLGYMYDTGNGVSGGKNMYKAVEYYRKGCTGRNAIGCSNLAIMYENGFGGLSKSTTQAIKYYRQALEISPNDDKVKRNLRRLGVEP